MEFKSTLERESVHNVDSAKEFLQTKEGTEEMKRVQKVYDLISDTAPEINMRMRSYYVAKTIQPSITSEDLRIAADLMCALGCEFVLKLEREGLITLKGGKQ